MLFLEMHDPDNENPAEADCITASWAVIKPDLGKSVAMPGARLWKPGCKTWK